MSADGHDRVRGAIAFSVFAAEVAKSYDVNIALHTDHALKDAVEAGSSPPRRVD